MAEVTVFKFLRMRGKASWREVHSGSGTLGRVGDCSVIAAVFSCPHPYGVLPMAQVKKNEDEYLLV